MRTQMKAALVALALVAACGKAANDAQKDERLRAEERDQPMSQPAVAQMADKMSAANAVGKAVSDVSQTAAPATPGSAFGRESIAPTMIIRSGNAAIEIDSLAIGVARVRELARRVGGFVANTQMQAGPQQTKAATLEIRLPSSRFDEAIAGLDPIGRLESVNVSAEDVGEEFVDVTARVGNAHRLEQRLIEVLATKTGRLRDVLDVEREIARVREDIERMEGRLRYLRARTSESTLSITVHEKYPVVGQRGSTSVIGGAFEQAWRNFIAFTARFIAALGTVIPTLLVLIACVAGIIAIFKRMQPKPKAE